MPDAPHEVIGPIVQFGTAIAMSLLAGVVLAATADWQLAGAMVVGSGLVALGMLRPVLFLSVLLLLRPLLDGNGGSRLQDIPSSNVGGALGLVLIVVVVLTLATTRRFTPPRGSAAFLAVLMVSILAALHATIEVEADTTSRLLTEVLRLCALFASFVLASQVIRTREQLVRLFVVVGLSGVVPAIVGIVQWIQGVEATFGYTLGRIDGTFTGPLPFSSYLAVSGLLLVTVPKDALRGAIRWPAVALVLTALVGTYSREGWILFLVGLLLIQWRERKSVVLAIIAAAIVTVALVPTVQERVLPAEKTETGQTAFESFGWRVDNWRGLLEQYSEKPLTGWGLRSTRYVNPRAPVQGQGVAGGGYEAHNTAVRALVEGGVLLLAAYIFLFAAMARTMYLGAMDRGWALRPYARIMLLLWGAIALIAIGTDDPVEATAMMVAVLALTGAVEGMHRRGQGQPRTAVTAGGPA